MISQELKAEILRLYHTEHWKIGTIANQLGLHPATTKRVIEREGTELPLRTRVSMVSSFLPLIEENIEKYPTLTATRLFEMLKQRGYKGQVGMVRQTVARIRGRRQPEAFLRLATICGEQAQVDWAYFGHLNCGKAKRALMAFVIVLSYSRAIYLRFFFSQNLPNFLLGHELAFQWFSGVPRVCFYDNLKSVVVERVGQAIRFNDQFLQFSGHYRFAPRPVAIARGNEKGRVERAIRYIRSNFFTARKFTDIDDLNRQAIEWCETNALERGWPQDPSKTVKEVFDTEKQSLLPLPENPYPCEERCEVSVGKSPWVRYDLNDYSVPHTAVKTTVVVFASPGQLRILEGDKVIATHIRSYDRNQQIEDINHTKSLKEWKSQASQHRGTNTLTKAVPSAVPLLELIVKRGLPLRAAIKALLSMLYTYGAGALDDACREAVANGTPHQQAVQHILERARKEQGKAPALPLALPNDPRLSKLAVKPHSLKDYETLLNESSKKDDNND